jgi:coenzyme F420 hydrogenase subunit beta
LSNKAGFEELQGNVISKERCTGCGACCTACPFERVLDYSEEGPNLVGECKKCGICIRACPRYRFDVSELEEFIFGRKRGPEDVLGIQISAHVAKALNPRTKSAGQDGAVATALLLNAFDSGLIDGAIVSSTDPSQPWLPIPSVARSSEIILGAAGTRYSYSPGIIALRKAAGEQLKQVAFVGTPCQVTAIRRMQKIFLRKVVGSLGPIVGLFCSESFSYKGLMLEKIRDGMGINLGDIEKMNIKGRMQVILKNGKLAEIPLKEARAYAQPFCRFCGDFSAELADISLGGAGLEGRTFTIVRTERGKRFLEAAVESGALELKPVEEFKNALDLVVRLSAGKRTRAQSLA